MKSKLRFLLAASLAAVAAPLPAQPAGPEAATNSISREKIGYAIGVSVGMNITNNLKRANFDVDKDQIVKAIQDVFSGKNVEMSGAEAIQTIREYQQQRMSELAEQNSKAGEAFLADNKKKEGIQTKDITLPDGKTAELQYKVLAPGEGENPGPTDTVEVKYRGTLIDGTEFDGTDRRGNQPATFRVNQVIRGWSEALQMMKPGAKWQLFIPASLAYGDRPPPGSGIQPGSVLIFDVELVEVVKQQSSVAPPRPLTSDIIRVPSAEEMKKGAKIEVIKASDLQKSNELAHATNGGATNAK